MNRLLEQRIGPYIVGDTIGQGQFAKVKLATHESTRQRVALKIISRKDLSKDPKSEIKIKREIKILRLLKHPHIIRLFDLMYTKTEIILCMEFVSGGELFDLLASTNTHLPEAEARHLFQQIISGVEYCHAFNVAHRDLKPENIMLDKKRRCVKIGDFGLSNIMRDGQFMSTSCGTPHYAAPEVIQGKLYGGFEADVWSCGVVLYTLLCSKLPFDEDEMPVLFRKIREARYRPPANASPEAVDLLRRILNPDPLQRATIAQIRSHRWFAVDIPAYILTPAASIHTVDGWGEDPRQGDTDILRDVARRLKVSLDEAEALLLEFRDAAEAASDASRDVGVAYSILLERKRMSVLLEESPMSRSVSIAESLPILSSQGAVQNWGSVGHLEHRPTLEKAKDTTASPTASPASAATISPPPPCTPDSVVPSAFSIPSILSPPEGLAVWAAPSQAPCIQPFTAGIPFDGVSAMDVLRKVYVVLVAIGAVWKVVNPFTLAVVHRNPHAELILSVFRAAANAPDSFVVDIRLASGLSLSHIDVVAKLYDGLTAPLPTPTSPSASSD